MPITSVGRVLVEEALPKEYHEYAKDLDEDRFLELLTRLAKEQPDKYQDTVFALSEVGKEVVSTYGDDATVSIHDTRAPETLKQFRERIRREIKQIVNSDIPSENKNKLIVEKMSSLMKTIPDVVLREAAAAGNGMATQVQSGSRGNKSQLMQLLFGDGLVLDANNRPVPVAGLHGYGEGVTPLEYWGAASGGRKGAVDVQFATAESGYLGKQLDNIGHRTVVTMDDCGTLNGLEVKTDDPDNIGSVLAKDVGPYKRGTILTKKILDDIKDDVIVVRSATTCRAKQGICSKCAGIREDNRLPDIGEVVGSVAARALAEPVTQAALRSKHIGGVAEGGKKEEKEIEGFEAVKQFLEVPKIFRGGAILSETDGIVEKIAPSPTGSGWNITISGQTFYVPGNKKVVVKQGDRITAGDVLSSGIPNPAELVRFKNIGEGRRYFVEQMNNLLKQSKAGVHRRNIEALARAFINRIRITEPEGFAGYVVDDVIPYDELAAKWKPRKGSILTNIRRAKNKYLETPYLHYTIGTRVTPGVIKDLAKHGVTSIVINDKPPPFEPVVVKSREILETDTDWMTRLGGEQLKRSLLASATTGAESNRQGTSYIPFVAGIK